MTNLVEVNTQFNLGRSLLHMVYNLSNFMIAGPLTPLVLTYWASGKFMVFNAAHLPGASTMTYYISQVVIYLCFVGATVLLILNRQNEYKPHLKFDLFPYVLAIGNMVIRSLIIGIRYGTMTTKEYHDYETKDMLGDDIKKSLLISTWINCDPEFFDAEVVKSMHGNVIVEKFFDFFTISSVQKTVKRKLTEQDYYEGKDWDLFESAHDVRTRDREAGAILTLIKEG